MAKTPIPKVPEEEFMRVIKALVNTPPTPMAEIASKRSGKGIISEPQRSGKYGVNERGEKKPPKGSRGPSFKGRRAGSLNKP